MNKEFNSEYIMFVILLVPVINARIWSTGGAVPGLNKTVSNDRLWFAGDVIPGLNRTIQETNPLESQQPAYQSQQNYQQLPQTTYYTQQYYPQQQIPQSSYQHQQPPQKAQPPLAASSSIQGRPPPAYSVNHNDDIVTNMISTAVKKIALSLDHTDGEQVKNLLIAPLSVFGALTLLLLGAQGTTKQEVENFLGLSDGDSSNESDKLHSKIAKYFNKFVPIKGVEDGHQLAFANSIFVQKEYSVNPRFFEIATKEYNSEVFPVDFLHNSEEARKMINKWIENKTFGRIKDIVPDTLSPNTGVVIANALYFNGNWEYPFYGRTRVGTFKVSKNEEIEMPLMVNGAEVPYHKTKDYEIFGMPYKGSIRIMYIIIPVKPLHEFAATLQPESIENMINLTQVQMVMYAVPRMKIETSLNLRKSLEKIGMPSLFDPAKSNLSGIANGLYASEIYHKVEIIVTETGTEAAAGTATGFVRGGMPIVRVDRPFIFFIYHVPTNSITFWGNVYKPTPYFEKKETN